MPDSSTPGRPWQYACLLTLQTIGVVIIYWKTLPLYRQVLDDPGSFVPRTQTRLWSFLAIALVQAGYWTRYRMNPPLPSLVNVFLGHLVTFFSRLVLTLGIAVFFFVFMLRRLGPQLPVVGYVMTLVGLFSLFLYTQELQRLGTALTPDETARKNNRSA